MSIDPPNLTTNSLEDNHFNVAHSATGATLNATLWNSKGQVWDVTNSEWVTYATANLSDYVIVGTEKGTASQLYVFDLPTSAVIFYDTAALANFCDVRRVVAEVYVQSGGSPAENDTHIKTVNMWLKLSPPSTPIINRPPSVVQDGMYLLDGSVDNDSFQGYRQLHLMLHRIMGRIP